MLTFKSDSGVTLQKPTGYLKPIPHGPDGFPTYEEPGSPPIPSQSRYESVAELHSVSELWWKKRLQWEKDNGYRL
jgi:hypothetical protein